MSAFSVPEKHRFRIEGVPDEAILTSGIGLGRPGKLGCAWKVRGKQFPDDVDQRVRVIIGVEVPRSKLEAHEVVVQPLNPPR